MRSVAICITRHCHVTMMLLLLRRLGWMRGVLLMKYLMKLYMRSTGWIGLKLINKGAEVSWRRGRGVQNRFLAD